MCISYLRYNLLYECSFLIYVILIIRVYLYLYTERNVFYGKRNA